MYEFDEREGGQHVSNMSEIQIKSELSGGWVTGGHTGL